MVGVLFWIFKILQGVTAALTLSGGEKARNASAASLGGSVRIQVRNELLAVVAAGPALHSPSQDLLIALVPGPAVPYHTSPEGQENQAILAEGVTGDTVLKADVMWGAASKAGED